MDDLPDDFELRETMDSTRFRTRSLSCSLLCLGFFILAMTVPCFVHATASLEYKDVVERARLLAEKDFEEPQKVPDFLLKLNYDDWRNIRFRPEEALWRADKLPFEAQFFHPGWLYDRKVIINVIEPAGVRPVTFSPDLFHYGVTEFKDWIPKDLGFAGLRLVYPINAGEARKEFIAFLGASYFRAVGKKQGFGLSARGVAVDTGMSSGEEFPSFKEFWLLRPQRKARSVTVFALLDSPSVTGAYQFDIQPEEATLVNVTSTLYLRKEVKKLGLAPLTSMFFYGEHTNIRPTDDFRPEIHDSDGLLIADGKGTWIWRPLINPKRLLVTSFQLNNPGGFGLFQRDRDFDHYQDLEANYHMRSTAWITPKNNWGEGRVELVQIPTDSEMNDNIVSYWVPANLPEPRKPISFSYQMKWGLPEIGERPTGRIVATRTAAGKEHGVKLYLIDFEGEKLRSLSEDAALEADIGVGGGEVIEQHLQKNSDTQDWRLAFQVKKKAGPLDRVTAGNDQPLELRAFLRLGDEVLTETWSHVDPF